MPKFVTQFAKFGTQYSRINDHQKNSKYHHLLPKSHHGMAKKILYTINPKNWCPRIEIDRIKTCYFSYQLIYDYCQKYSEISRQLNLLPRNGELICFWHLANFGKNISLGEPQYINCNKIKIIQASVFRTRPIPLLLKTVPLPKSYIEQIILRQIVVWIKMYSLSAQKLITTA